MTGPYLMVLLMNFVEYGRRMSEVVSAGDQKLLLQHQLTRDDIFQIPTGKNKKILTQYVYQPSLDSNTTKIFATLSLQPSYSPTLKIPLGSTLASMNKMGHH